MTANDQTSAPKDQHEITRHRPQPIAIVGLGAIMPEAPNVAAFWENITKGRYCITDVPKDRWDPELYYDPDPRGAGQDVLPHRRLGPRLPLGPDRLAPAAPAQGQRSDGRRPEVGRLGGARRPRRRRLATVERSTPSGSP